MPTNVTVKCPHSRIVGHKTNLGPSRGRNRDNITPQIIVTIESLGLGDITCRHDPETDAMRMYRVFSPVRVINQNFNHRPSSWYNVLGILVRGNTPNRLWITQRVKRVRRKETASRRKV